MSDFNAEGLDPPWVVFPEIKPRELSAYLKQGVTETWFDQHWRPFWSSLTPDQQRDYLDHWQTTEEWRDAVAYYFNPEPGFDVDADTLESKAFLETWRKKRKK